MQVWRCVRQRSLVAKAVFAPAVAHSECGGRQALYSNATGTQRVTVSRIQILLADPDPDPTGVDACTSFCTLPPLA